MNDLLNGCPLCASTGQLGCPVCGVLFSVSFMFLTMFFGEEHKQAKGKQLGCPSCGCPLWVSTDGKIELPLVLLAGREPRLPSKPASRGSFLGRLRRLSRDILTAMAGLRDPNRLT